MIQDAVPLLKKLSVRGKALTIEGFAKRFDVPVTADAKTIKHLLSKYSSFISYLIICVSGHFTTSDL